MGFFTRSLQRHSMLTWTFVEFICKECVWGRKTEWASEAYFVVKVSCGLFNLFVLHSALGREVQTDEGSSDHESGAEGLPWLALTLSSVPLHFLLKALSSTLCWSERMWQSNPTGFVSIQSPHTNSTWNVLDEIGSARPAGLDGCLSFGAWLVHVLKY